MFFRIREQQSGPVDYVVTDAANADPWFAGTGFRAGDKVLDVVGNEWDALPETPQPGCDQSLTRLFHYDGAPQNADAVRYTAPSGARIFSSGAQQWSWSLDTFNLGVHGRTLPPDTRLQQFMRNVLADLGRPAPPAALDARVVRRTVTLRMRRRSDPRIQAFRIFRANVGICRTTTGVCTLRRVRPGTYRFSAVAVDEWGESAPVLSRKVVVRRRR
jgi:hypothetical protein